VKRKKKKKQKEKEKPKGNIIKAVCDDAYHFCFRGWLCVLAGMLSVFAVGKDTLKGWWAGMDNALSAKRKFGLPLKPNLDSTYMYV